MGLLRCVFPRVAVHAGWKRNLLPATRRFHQRAIVCESLVEKRCVPCEKEKGALSYMGLCEALGKSEAENLLTEVDPYLPAFL